MNFWATIIRLDVYRVFKLLWIGIRHPLYVYPTIKATQKTIKICNSHYPGSHHKNGKANAFRHALWAMLLCLESYKVFKNRDKVMAWAKKITDFHEKLAPNSILETVMDIHNNTMGIRYFSTLRPYASQEKIILYLKTEIQNAKKIKDSQEVVHIKDTMVYISS